ncbi:MAG TPA: hypothetical protein VN670_08775 [Acidobacteriaceae bacterium]|nr:hypothetical protein [Acidobacteriaceae bacterium]
MVNNCANPKCAKPLHYLREGRIFVFDAESGGDARIHRMEHFWLCGVCSQTLRLEKTARGVRAVLKPGFRMTEAIQDVRQPLAS